MITKSAILITKSRSEPFCSVLSWFLVGRYYKLKESLNNCTLGQHLYKHCHENSALEFGHWGEGCFTYSVSPFNAFLLSVPS